MSVNIAKVIIDSPLPHLDHVFDYRIPDNLKALVSPGIRIRVPFRNRRVDGYVLAVTDSSEVSGRLLDIETVISSEVVLTKEVARLCKTVAHRNVGNLHDVIRAAVPPRHARAEKREIKAFDTSTNYNIDLTQLNSCDLADFYNVASAKKIAVVDIGISESFISFINDLLEHNLSNAIILLPDQYDVSALMETIIDPRLRSRIAILTSQQSSEQRYVEFLKVLRGASDLVIGTRSAVFAPLSNLKSIVVIDDGDDIYISPQAPYWNATEVAVYRTELEGCKLVLASRARSIECVEMLESGKAILVPSRSTRTEQRVFITDYSDGSTPPTGYQARIPTPVFKVLRTGLQNGNVLISVPRKGYLPVVACAKCRTLFRCLKCNGAIAISQTGSDSSCTRCGMVVGVPICSKCGGNQARSLITGLERTAEEIGKAFPGHKVVSVHGDNRTTDVIGKSGIVIAMPGTEPLQFYSAVVVLDTHLSLSRPEGNSQIRYLRHLLRLRNLLQENGEMVVVGGSDNHVLQAFLRYDSSRIAEELYQDRISARLNPYARTAKVTGDWNALVDLTKIVPKHAQIWGPIKNTNSNSEKHEASILISVPKFESEELVNSIRGWVVSRSANRQSAVAIRIDPDDL